MSQKMQRARRADPSYSLAPDLEIIVLGGEEWLLRTTTSTTRLGGSSARLLIERVLPLLENGCRWSRLVARLPRENRHGLRRTLDDLVLSGVLRRNSGLHLASEPSLSPLLTLLDALQLPVDAALVRLAQARVTIFGLEGMGVHLALLLARCGLRHFTLVDPYLCQPGNLPLLPVGGPADLGRPRQELVAAELRALYPAGEIDLALGPADLSPEYVARVVAESDCVISCFDSGFTAMHHWVNRASLRAEVAAAYATAAGHQGWAGPLVLPGRTGCYMCYRMRAIACADDSATALAYEQHLDRQNLPRLHARAVLPSLMPQLAGLLATTVLQVVLGLQQPALAGRVLECQALTLATAAHPVLQHPDCPECGGGGWPAPSHPDLAGLVAEGDAAVDLLQIASQLISQHTGIIREARWNDKDVAEPAIPYVAEVKLANYRFQPGFTDGDRTCWGKGRTYREAFLSGVGEASERYASDWVDLKAIVSARRGQLDGASLHPADLVLYAPEQYAALPYHPYQEDSIMGWVRGRSLAGGAPVYLPAFATFLGYQPQHPAEDLCQVTSNGIAAGPSLVRAILAAAYEVLERDAFMITWFARLAARRVDPLTHPDERLRAVCQAYGRRGVAICLWRLPTDHPCSVFLALGVQRTSEPGPAATVGLGADLDPAAAARKAILEVGQIRPAYRRNLRLDSARRRVAELVEDPQRVATMHDHGLLYSSPAMLPALDFLLDRAIEPADWTPFVADPRTQLATLVGWFQATNRDFLYYNLTPPDLAQLGLAATRVILPGFQPVAFGAQEMRLGGSRLYELPQQLGQAPARLRREDLNPYPHPFD